MCACFISLFVYAYSYVGLKSPLAPACVIIVWFFPTLNKAYCIVLYCIVFYMRHNSFQISIIMCSYTNIFAKKNISDSNWNIVDKVSCNATLTLTWNRILMTKSQSCPPHSWIINQRICNQSNTTGTTSGTEAPYPLGASEFTMGFVMFNLSLHV